MLVLQCGFSHVTRASWSYMMKYHAALVFSRLRSTHSLARHRPALFTSPNAGRFAALLRMAQNFKPARSIVAPVCGVSSRHWWLHREMNQHIINIMIFSMLRIISILLYDCLYSHRAIANIMTRTVDEGDSNIRTSRRLISREAVDAASPLNYIDIMSFYKHYSPSSTHAVARSENSFNVMSSNYSRRANEQYQLHSPPQHFVDAIWDRHLRYCFSVAWRHHAAFILAMSLHTMSLSRHCIFRPSRHFFVSV